jgi:hypothetical protein
VLSGANTSSGSDNSFYGVETGTLNTTGSNNSFFGRLSGYKNETGNDNAFYGLRAGFSNTTGSDNVFLGERAGNDNVTGNSNTAVGNGANVGFTNLDHATAIGAGVIVTSSNRVQIGRITLDTVALGGLGSGGFLPVCLAGDNVFATCSSSLRYKESIQPFTSGLNLLQRLRPVSFNWKGRVETDLGLIAEEVAEVEPLLITRNHKGEIEGVKYSQLNVVLINAIKEQQSQIQQQQQQIDQQQRQIDALKKLLCQQNPQAEICR